MFLLGALNLVVATTMSFQAWAWFITFGAVGAKVVAFLAAILDLPVDHPPQIGAPSCRPQAHGSTTMTADVETIVIGAGVGRPGGRAGRWPWPATR